MADKQPRTQNQQIVIRMTEEDFNIMKEKVKESGLKQAEYLRQVILNPRIVNTEGMGELVPEIKRVGNNLNQLTRAVNAGSYDPMLIDKVMQIGKDLDEVWQLLKRYVAEQV